MSVQKSTIVLVVISVVVILFTANQPGLVGQWIEYIWDGIKYLFGDR